MRPVPSSVLLGMLACVAMQPATPQDVAGIDACVGRLDPQVDIGYERIAARCPELARALAASGLSPWLPSAWRAARNELSAANLAALADLARRELATQAPAQAPDLRRLHAILAQLQGADAPPPSAWQRFKRWLRAVLEPDEPSRQRSWLAALLDPAGMSQTVLELICVLALAAVSVLAGMILFQEIHLAAPFASVPRARRSRRTPRDDADRFDWDEIDAAALSEKLRLLLERLTARLMRRGVLPPAAAMTARELGQAVRLPQADRERLLQIATACERVRFSGRPVAPQELQLPLAAGRTLLERLEASESAP